MWGALLCVLGAATVRVVGANDGIGKGVWIVQNVYKCADHDEYPYELEVQRRKVNRTHDGFSGTMDILKDITNTNHGVFMEVCKRVDGGCKLQHTFNDASFCNFAKQYAEDNFHAILSNAGVDPAECPIPTGKKEFKEFIFNYAELPEDGIIGEFTATGYLTESGSRVACIMLDLKFTESDDDDDDEEE